MNPYQKFVFDVSTLISDGKRQPLGGFPPASGVPPAPNAPRVLIFSPHPDDECIIGALPLRMRRELKWNVIDVAVTQGSKKERQAGRLHELTEACRYLGFGVIQTRENGLEKINGKGRESDPAAWAESVRIVRGILESNGPKVIFIPHAQDWNTTHIGTHLLVVDALKSMGPSAAMHVVETEYWQAMSAPNLMAECSAGDLADLMAALSFHVEEVKRNPYHLGLPAWMMDNVRRGAEIVLGQGAQSPSYLFASLYRVRQWKDGQLQDAYRGGKQVAAGESLSEIFRLA